MKTSILILAVFALLGAQSVKAQDAKQIAEKSTQVIASDAMEMTSTLKIYDDKGNIRTRQISNSTKKFGTVTKTLIKFLSPADVKGTSMLIYDNENKDDDMWVYLPSLKKTRRIVSSEKSSSFMGSEFSNSDMSKPNMLDFNFKLLGTEVLNGKTCYKIESSCKTKEIELIEKFTKKISFIEKDTYLINKVDSYDKDNKLIKTLTYSNYKKLSNGKYMAYKMVAQNHKTNRKSEVIVDKYVESSSLPETYFTSTNLQN